MRLEFDIVPKNINITMKVFVQACQQKRWVNVDESENLNKIKNILVSSRT